MRWMLRVLAWDGVLPLLVWIAPQVVSLVLPGRRGAIELAGIGLPIMAFLLRFHAGYRMISTNHCGPRMRAAQVGALFLGIFVLVPIDAMMILSHELPPGTMFRTSTDTLVFLALFAFYLSAMTIAAYPGREPSDQRDLMT